MAHIPRKRFGQHFLVDQDVIAAIVDVIHPQPADLMVEIGPGLGALTKPLLARLDRLHVVEIDRDVIAQLRRDFSNERLTIHEGDALKFDFGALAAGDERPGMRVVGNLPYNISTPLLFHLAEFAPRIVDCTFMLQAEVVERMVAAPGGKEYGRLSVMLQYRFEMEQMLEVPPEAFDPPPRVDSAIVRMVPKAAGAMNATSLERLSKLVTQAFSQRRKVLRNTLKGHVSEAQMEAAGIDARARAEEIPLENYVRLANALEGGGADAQAASPAAPSAA
ncbi:MAG: rRNA ((1518)-N(6)/adenine(1519)-N(6))-dimethyltransferase RsmA [Betaproteobacteria bacterium]|nr:rRNA ((1518)-N(6)/adenine(1519)-N(6))-dimethyltransferase RsmA [Betaproteobacteria bacterium]